MFFLAHSSITTYALSFFSCRSFTDDRSFMTNDTEVECWSKKHHTWVWAVAFPGLVIWGIGFPLATLMFLTKYRTDLDNVITRARFGFLLRGYKPQKFYWEFVILYRKLVLAAAGIFLYHIHRSIQALLAFAILVGSLYLQNTNKPYISRELNLLETRSLIVSAITIYCGLYYLTDGVGVATRIILFTLILCANIYFIVHWFNEARKRAYTLLERKNPALLRKCGCCFAGLSEGSSRQELEIMPVGRSKKKIKKELPPVNVDMDSSRQSLEPNRHG
mmetsp:Transcript_28609/g.32703  ORF Transcript_28609/g.32703 Transcript_28609/m.32703 type:complete len:276 (-) Transcript_28609:241-1068(-)